jgi:hypothetical protein
MDADKRGRENGTAQSPSERAAALRSGGGRSVENEPSLASLRALLEASQACASAVLVARRVGASTLPKQSYLRRKVIIGQRDVAATRGQGGGATHRLEGARRPAVSKT